MKIIRLLLFPPCSRQWWLIVNALWAISILVFSHSAYSWGKLGHQVVCDIAWHHSTPSTQRLLAASAKRMGYKTFADSCAWADAIKSNARYDDLKPLHYVNVKRDETAIHRAVCVANPVSQASPKKLPQCVLTAIPYYWRRIEHEQYSQREQDQALLLFAHFVGDVHQPLHVSYADDRGGTRRQVVYQGKLLSLHYLWDTQLLYCQSVNGKRPTWRSLGRQLASVAPTKADPAAVVVSTSANISQQVQYWAQESLDITRRLYTELNARKPSVGQRSSASPRLSKRYCATHYPLVLSRLQQAGIRLSQLLESRYTRP
ncbi:S1/P1 nuclease [Eionea flava]